MSATIRTTKILISVTFILLFMLSTVGAYAGSDRIYSVTVENLSAGQPLSPVLAATHHKNISMFSVGQLASGGLEAIAEDGNSSKMFNRFFLSGLVTRVIDLGVPLTPFGTIIGDFTDTVNFKILAHPEDKFTMTAMLICTNDGFVGLDRVDLPVEGGVVYWLDGYDAGTEMNTEDSVDIVDPCGGLGPVALPADGNEDILVDMVPHQPIQLHPTNIAGIGDLTAAHAWTDPIVKVTIMLMP